MDIQEALELLGAVGSDNAPSVEQLKACRTTFVNAAKIAKEKGDRTALASMIETIRVADQAIEEGEKLAAEAAEELETLAADIPELAGEELESNSDEGGEDSEESPRLLSVAEAVQRLGLSPQSQTVEVTEREPSQSLRINGEEVNDATWQSMGDAFAKFTKQSMRGGRSTLATFTTEYENRLPGKSGENSRVLDQLARKANDEAITAAGGCCSLAEPIRDQPMLASLSRPIADSLPTVGTSTGKVTFFNPICLPQEGVGIWTCEDDAAVDAADESTWKECSEIDCEDVQEVVVDAIYRCLTIGNFQHRFSGERWEAILHATAAQQARMAEQVLFGQIRDSELTTAHTVNDTGSVYATVVNALLRAASIIKTNQRYDNLRVKAILPEWVRDAATLDITARALTAGRATDVSDIDVALAAKGVDVVWSPDIAPFDEGEDGALPEFPDEFEAVVYIDGGVFRLDGGELNLGTEIRDHDLNRQNKLAAFAESFEGSVVRSCETLALTIPVTVCDQAACI